MDSADAAKIGVSALLFVNVPRYGSRAMRLELEVKMKRVKDMLSYSHNSHMISLPPPDAYEFARNM